MDNSTRLLFLKRPIRREQKVARALGLTKKGQVTRTNHKSTSTRVVDSTLIKPTTETNMYNILKEKKDLPKPRRENHCIGCDGPVKPGGPGNKEDKN